MKRLTKTFKNGECHTLRTCCAPYYKKLSQLEDIEEELEKLTFYGKVFQYPNQLMLLHFLKIYHGKEYATDIRIEFELKNGLGNVFYHIWDYGKTWALTKEELL